MITLNPTDAGEALRFLESLVEKVKSENDALALLQMELAHYKLLGNDVAACEQLIESTQKLLDRLPSIEPAVHANFYRVNADFCKVKGLYAEFYKNALLYLACVSLETMPPAERLDRSYDLGLAALMADSLYNFGELVRSCWDLALCFSELIGIQSLHTRLFNPCTVHNIVGC